MCLTAYFGAFILTKVDVSSVDVSGLVGSKGGAQEGDRWDADRPAVMKGTAGFAGRPTVEAIWGGGTNRPFPSLPADARQRICY
jgi:hypothetical protein